MESKKPWQSKTNWMAVIVALVAFIPGVGEYVGKNVEVVGLLLGALFAGLRMISKGKISIE